MSEVLLTREQVLSVIPQPMMDRYPNIFATMLDKLFGKEVEVETGGE